MVSLSNWATGQTHTAVNYAYFTKKMKKKKENDFTFTYMYMYKRVKI